jgi:hypothetical protein
MYQKRIAAAAWIAGCWLLGSSAHADVRYTTVMSMNGGDADAKSMAMEMTYYVKGSRERQEMSMNAGMFAMKNVSITQCDTNQEIQIDDQQKVYTAKSLSAGISGFIPTPPAGGFGGGAHRGMPRKSTETPGTGTVDTSFSTQDLGKEKVNGFDTRHYMLTIHTKSTGCAGNEDRNMKMEMWVAPGTLGRLDCPARFQPSSPTLPTQEDNPCKITTHFTGDMSAMRDMFAHLIVKQIMYNDDKPMMTIEVKDYSTAAQDPSLFAVPTDFKKVTQDEFSKAQTRNMMKQFGGGAGMPHKPADTPETDETPTPDEDKGPNIHTGDTPSIDIPQPDITVPDPTDKIPDVPNPKDEIKKRIKIPHIHL